MNKRTFNVLRITKGIDRSRLWLRTLSIVVCVALLVTAISAWAQTGLPIVGRTYAESTPGTPPTLPVATGAPNVIWILLDDVGYGASSTFGGGAHTPVLDSLAKNGVST
jgi:arylsulfatase